MTAARWTPVLLRRPLDAGAETLDEYRAAGGYAALARAVAELTPVALTELVTAAELRGRGGAAFPTGRKWELARTQEGPTKYVVANGGEHEPGSRKDQVLLSLHPHSVLEGMALAGYATGANKGYLYVIEDMHPAIDACRAAIEQAEAGGLLGRRILGSEFDFEVALQLAPTTYVAGEETAALEVIEGRPALPRTKPPFPGTSGAFGCPTTVNNVETLAHVPGIVRNGAAWFRGLGVDGSAGSMLFTLDDTLCHPGVYELPFGRPFRELIEGCGGGLASGGRIKAILPARSSAFLPGSALELPMDRDAVAAQGSSLGCGGIAIVEQGQCIVESCLAIAQFFAREQCGQCPPCRMETTTLEAILGKLVRGDEPGDYRTQIERITSFTAKKGRCSLIEMAAAPVLSALRLFPDDFAHHAAHHRCP